MSPNQYEQQYGRIPDEDVIIPGVEQDAAMETPQAGEVDSSAVDESIEGFGSHFMLNNGQDQYNGFTQQVKFAWFRLKII